MNRSLTFRIPLDLWDKLQAFMKKERRSATNAIVLLLWEALEKRGYYEKGDD